MADAVRLAGVSFAYGCTPAVADVTLAVPAGAFLTLLGPSGCGKSTLLKLIGGYLTPAAGRVTLRGQDVTARPPEGRTVGTVFQSYALFPHLSARRNVAFGLEVRRKPKAEIDRRVTELLERVGLAGLGDRLPAELSGGQQQRVALARALAIGPDVLLLDEPMASVDRPTRDQLLTELRRLHEQAGVTTVMVTHDRDEALAVSDLVAVMAAGRVEQIGPPDEVYSRPRTRTVAEFLGDGNLLDGGPFGRPGATLLVRPEQAVLEPPGGPAWDGRVTRVGFQVADVDCGRFTLTVRTPGRLRIGEAVRIGLPAEMWAVPEASGPLL